MRGEPIERRRRRRRHGAVGGAAAHAAMPLGPVEALAACPGSIRLEGATGAPRRVVGARGAVAIGPVRRVRARVHPRPARGRGAVRAGRHLLARRRAPPWGRYRYEVGFGWFVPPPRSSFWAVQSARGFYCLRHSQDSTTMLARLAQRSSLRPAVSQGARMLCSKPAPSGARRACVIAGAPAVLAAFRQRRSPLRA